MKGVHEIALRPYNGRCFVTFSRGDYQAAHVRLFRTPDVLSCDQEGRFGGGEGVDGLWTYLVFADKPHALVHELSHVVLHVFERCGIDPREAGGEPFCYMLSQLLLDCQQFK